MKRGMPAALKGDCIAHRRRFSLGAYACRLTVAPATLEQPGLFYAPGKGPEHFFRIPFERGSPASGTSEGACEIRLSIPVPV